jgi:hypothetical protein
MKSFVFMLVAVGALSARAADPNEAKLRAVLERNFQACNEEDIKALMDTQARTLPRDEMAEFQSAAEKLFADTDVYLRLEEFQLLKVQGQFAAARVVQVTLPADESIRNNPDECERFYRNNTVLMPEHERVEYIQTFKREGGKWRLWEIVTKPVPVGEAQGVDKSGSGPGCPDGQCIRQPAESSVFR